MLELKTEGELSIIESDWCISEVFDILNPIKIERSGMTEDSRGVYKLIYLLKEENKKWKL